jgi:hypothetical protein
MTLCELLGGLTVSTHVLFHRKTEFFEPPPPIKILIFICFLSIFFLFIRKKTLFLLDSKNSVTWKTLLSKNFVFRIKEKTLFFWIEKLCFIEKTLFFRRSPQKSFIKFLFYKFFFFLFFFIWSDLFDSKNVVLSKKLCYRKKTLFFFDLEDNVESKNVVFRISIKFFC